MKILFAALHFGSYRNFESVIVSLAERGHDIHLSADEREDRGGAQLVERLMARYPRITASWTPPLEDEAWFRLARRLRIGRDYVRFHGRAFRPFVKTRAHLADRVPPVIVRAMRSRAGNNPLSRRAVLALLSFLEHLMPISPALAAYLEERDPDLVLSASATTWRTPQIDLLRAARAAGRRTGICVFSWDHLSSKALLRGDADRVFVWNETQQREAVAWHGVAPGRVTITGAQSYDHWFGRPPSRTRDAFCRGVGLDPDRPFLLYVCSVMTPDPNEAAFVLRWIAQVRAHADERVRNAGILIRPHPERMEEWAGADFGGIDNVALFGRNPVSPDAQDDYFDSLHHSHAVIGLVTSAFLEAAIVGRPVYTLMLPEFQPYQEGVAHFRYLLNVEGGLLETARTFDDHLGQLAGALAGTPQHEARNARFVEAFVRPFGLDVPATRVFVDAVERMAAVAPLAASAPGPLHAMLQPTVAKLAESTERGWARPWLRGPETDKERAKRDAVAAKAAYQAEKQVRLQLRADERRREQRTREHRKQLARLKGRLKSLMGLASR